MRRRWSPYITSPQLGTNRSRKTTDTGLVHRVVCPFTPQFSQVLINRPQRDDMLSWRWCTAATGGIRTPRSQVRHRSTRPSRTMLGLQPVIKVHWLKRVFAYGFVTLCFTRNIFLAASSFYVSLLFLQPRDKLWARCSCWWGGALNQREGSKFR